MNIGNKTTGKYFDRSMMTYYPLSERQSKVDISETCISSENYDRPIPRMLQDRLGIIAEEIIMARKNGRPVVCAFGAHAIKNGLGRLLGSMAVRGWFSHLATNGAGIIHDWEFAFQGKSSEDVRENVREGRFGTWEETGLYINLALAAGGAGGLGYGASVGSMIIHNGLVIPEREDLLAGGNHGDGAALDLYELVEDLKIPSGFFSIDHPYAQYSVQAIAFKSQTPFTGHPMFGHDIIYTHRANRGAAVGRTAERDFLEFVKNVESLEGGIYLSVGSAVMSPMIFEKALSMARNTAHAQGKKITDCSIHVVDLQQSSWDWSAGEPPPGNPAYYLRFMKTFSRMGCKTDYTSADNRDFFVGLYRALEGKSGGDPR
ncbi:MAG: hypothetical protein LBL44_06985 [Treponema sp.]|jgi:hypothetical protein|nr:hypothetical protein [Treponema sp.]